MIKILVIFHSQTGNTEKLASAVKKGIEDTEDAIALFKKAQETNADHLRQSHAVIICSPEYFGYMAGAIKDLFDRTYEELKDDKKIFKKPYAIVISAGNDGTGALNSIERILRGFKFKMVQHPIISKGTVTEEVLDRCYELGRTVAEGVKAGIF